MGGNIRILIADDHRILREGLRSLLQAQLGTEVVAEAEDGRTAVAMAAELLPDVVVMDINMPDLNGIEATRRIRGGAEGHEGGPKVIALSGHADERFAREMLRAGASGYVLKESAFDELAAAVHAAVAGRVYLSPTIAEVVVGGYVRGGGSGTPDAASVQRNAFSDLTAREREILQLMAEGKSTKQIALHLHVSGKTVETHRRNLMEKLELHSVAELTKYALREGLTSL
jgi:DNA-binding NarL/FixJ family response regulator